MFSSNLCTCNIQESKDFQVSYLQTILKKLRISSVSSYLQAMLKKTRVSSKLIFTGNAQESKGF